MESVGKCEVSNKNLFMTVEEANRIFQNISPAEQKYRVLLLLVAHGCRPCEAVRLKLQDFTKADCTEFYATNTKVAYNGRQPRRDLKVVPAWVGAEIRQYLEKAYLDGQIRDGYIFPTSTPRLKPCMSPESLLTWFSKLRRRIGMNDVVGYKDLGNRKRVPQYRIGVYSFRRLFATELAFAGADQRVIAALMGHKDLSITCQYQDKVRLLQLAPKQVALMPRFLEPGQTRISEYLQPRIEVRHEAATPASQVESFQASVPGAVKEVKEQSFVVVRKRVKGKCESCGGSLKQSRLSGKVFCKECWEYEPVISH